MEGDLERTLREVEADAQRERDRRRALTVSWVLLAVGLALMVACMALLPWALPRMGREPRERTVWAVVIGVLSGGLAVSAVAVLFFAGRIWRIVLGVSHKRPKHP